MEGIKHSKGNLFLTSESQHQFIIFTWSLDEITSKFNSNLIYLFANLIAQRPIAKRAWVKKRNKTKQFILFEWQWNEADCCLVFGYILKTTDDLFFKEISSSVHFLASAFGPSCSQNWKMCHVVWSQPRVAQSKFLLEHCYFDKYFARKRICSLYVMFIHLLSDVNKKCEAKHQVVGRKLKKTFPCHFAKKNQSYMYFNIRLGPTAWRPFGREHPVLRFA